MAREYEWGNGNLEILKTLPNEITVKQLQTTIELQKKYGDNITFEYYLEVFEVLGLTTSFVDKVDADTMFEIIRDFKEDFIIDGADIIKSITYNGKRYQLCEEDEEFVISARLMASVEGLIFKEPKTWISKALAMVYKEVGKNEDLKPGMYLNNKAKSFSNITLDVAIPVISAITTNYVDNLKILLDE